MTDERRKVIEGLFNSEMSVSSGEQPDKTIRDRLREPSFPHAPYDYEDEVTMRLYQLVNLVEELIGEVRALKEPQRVHRPAAWESPETPETAKGEVGIDRKAAETAQERPRNLTAKRLAHEQARQSLGILAQGNVKLAPAEYVDDTERKK